MKSNIIAASLFAILLFSCAPKVVVSATKPDTVQVPPKMPSPAETKPVTESLVAGKSLYENNCARCHKLFSPKEFSKEDWSPILVKMQKKTHLDDATMAGISNYIYSEL